MFSINLYERKRRKKYCLNQITQVWIRSALSPLVISVFRFRMPLIFQKRQLHPSHTIQVHLCSIFRKFFVFDTQSIFKILFQQSWSWFKSKSISFGSNTKINLINWICIYPNECFWWTFNGSFRQNISIVYFRIATLCWQWPGVTEGLRNKLIFILFIFFFKIL